MTHKQYFRFLDHKKIAIPDMAYYTATLVFGKTNQTATLGHMHALKSRANFYFDIQAEFWEYQDYQP